MDLDVGLARELSCRAERAASRVELVKSKPEQEREGESARALVIEKERERKERKSVSAALPACP